MRDTSCKNLVIVNYAFVVTEFGSAVKLMY